MALASWRACARRHTKQVSDGWEVTVGVHHFLDHGGRLIRDDSVVNRNVPRVLYKH